MDTLTARELNSDLQCFCISLRERVRSTEKHVLLDSMAQGSRVYTSLSRMLFCTHSTEMGSHHCLQRSH